MAKILSRPMFRKVGSANNGIMDGLVDRKGYLKGTDNPWIEEAREALRTDAPRDTSLSEMLIGGGLNVVSGAGAGEGLLANLAKSYKGPSEEFFKKQRESSAYERKVDQAAAQAGLEQKWALEQIKAKDDPNRALRNVYLTQAIENGLIDLLGTMEDAVIMAAQMAGLKGKPLMVYPPEEKKGLLNILFGNIFHGTSLSNLNLYPQLEYKINYQVK